VNSVTAIAVYRKKEKETGMAPTTPPQDPPQKNEPKRSFGRPSDRMFRRSRAAENRRRTSLNKDARFFRIVSTLATAGIFIVFVVIIFMSKAAYGAGSETPTKTGPETGADSEMTQPLLGGFSALDLLGLAFVIVAGYAVFRKYNNKDK